MVYKPNSNIVVLGCLKAITDYEILAALHKDWSQTLQVYLADEVPGQS
jgi:hypothetical protein